MNSQRLGEHFFLLLCIGVICTSSSPASGEPIAATPAYREAFGPPPESEAPSCRAAGVFLPGVGASGDPARLGPLPLFSLNPDHIAEEAARVLVEGYPTPVRFFEPPRIFPVGSKLAQFTVQGGVATVGVSPGAAGAPDPLAVQALAHTLTQFSGIRSVALAVSGGPAAAPGRPDPALAEPPPPPRLLDVVSSVHPGEQPAEMDVLFDRPVRTSSFSLRLKGNTGLPGRTYTSMFDMAVVFRPEDPEIIREGLPLELTWRVEDRTGRIAEGAQTVALRLYRPAGGGKPE